MFSKDFDGQYAESHSAMFGTTLSGVPLDSISKSVFIREEDILGNNSSINGSGNTAVSSCGSTGTVEELNAVNITPPLNVSGESSKDPTLVISSIPDLVGSQNLSSEVISTGIPRLVNTFTITNVINNKFGEVRTVVYDQHYYSDGSVQTVQNVKSVGGQEFVEIGVDYEQYYLHETYHMGKNTVNVFLPKIPHVEPEVEDLTDKFNSFGINSYQNNPSAKQLVDNGQVVLVSRESEVLPDYQGSDEEYSEEEVEYPLCPICQTDTLELQTDGEHFLCSQCGAFLAEDFDEEQIRHAASMRGVTLQPLVEYEEEEEVPASSTQ